METQTKDQAPALVGFRKPMHSVRSSSQKQSESTGERERSESRRLISPTNVSIAVQSDAFMEKMSRDELCELITLAECHLPIVVSAERLRLRSIEELRLLAFLVRRMCREQLYSFPSH